MSFADEIRNQAKTKEQVAQEEEQQQKEWEESYRRLAVQEYEKVSSSIKTRISDAAKTGSYRQEGLEKIIEETFLLFEGTTMDWTLRWTKQFLEKAGFVETADLIRTRKGLFQPFPLELRRIYLRPKYSWGESVFHDFLDGLRKEGIDASFQLKWLVGQWTSPGFCAQGKEYELLLEDAVSGYQFEQWFDPRLMDEDRIKELANQKRLYCTYKFRF